MGFFLVRLGGLFGKKWGFFGKLFYPLGGWYKSGGFLVQNGGFFGKKKRMGFFWYVPGCVPCAP